jgi:hypothetical protein
MVGVVVAGFAVDAVVPFLEVKQFPSHLLGGQVEEMSDRFHLHGREGPVQADERVLENIVRLLPSPQAWKASEHLAGEFEEPVTGMVDEQGLGTGVALFGEFDQALKLCVSACWHRWLSRGGRTGF